MEFRRLPFASRMENWDDLTKAWLPVYGDLYIYERLAHRGKNLLIPALIGWKYLAYGSLGTLLAIDGYLAYNLIF